MSNQPIAGRDTADPWILKHDNMYYLTFTTGNGVELWASENVEDFHNPRVSQLWLPGEGEHWNSEIWAPELHRIDDTWYVYFSATSQAAGGPGHRTMILRSRDADPMKKEAWEFLGPLKGVPDDQWAIDATVFKLQKDGRDQLYLVYSGWPFGAIDADEQALFLVRMESPEQAVRDSVTRISHPHHPWERPDHTKRGINEGPAFVRVSGWEGIVYSAHASWGPDYKLALLKLTNPNDPCREDSWEKRPLPLLISHQRPPYGPGHASFLPGDNDQSVLCVYHGTENNTDGWGNRKGRIMRINASAFAQDAKPVCCTDGNEVGGVDWQKYNDTSILDYGVRGFNITADMAQGMFNKFKK